ncbi:hypothetical protein GPECTOR_84g312 [Gonium pectorale]|uniref:Chitin-binding type-2 domain-containing protein n=1 Tax=Gonium pectorale TaxID=33097 RepID=A0A150G189_GONPE|nr:hypothetical protein GPECTOR_84g312 [Gonium pectorale]|eukprot:KXZ43636.1 hypothetical protein GPECTOR_84g312 [Gonium pectorale]
MAIVTALSGGIRSAVCPRIDTGLYGEAMPLLAPPGCPCNYTANAAFNRCPAGYICSRQAARSVPNDYFFEPSWEQMQAACVPCVQGQYCPDGSLGEADEVDKYDCPAGLFCPTPAEQSACPAGAYCPPRSTQPTSCTHFE